MQGLNLLLSPYPCFISLLYLDLYVLGDDALIISMQGLNLLLSPYPCFISLLYLDLYVLGDDALIS